MESNLQASRTVSENAKSSLITLALHGSDGDFYDLLSRELWIATSKLVIEVVGFKLRVDVKAKAKNIPLEYLTFDVRVEAYDRMRNLIASQIVSKRCDEAGSL